MSAPDAAARRQERAASPLIRKLRWQFVAACMGLITVVLAIVFGCVWASAQHALERSSHTALEQAFSRRDGALLPGLRPGEEVPAPAGEGLLQGHVAAVLQGVLGGGPDTAEDNGQHCRDEAHAGGHELPAEFFDHGAGRQLLPPLAGVRGAHASSRQ